MSTSSAAMSSRQPTKLKRKVNNNTVKEINKILFHLWSTYIDGSSSNHA